MEATEAVGVGGYSGDLGRSLQAPAAIRYVKITLVPSICYLALNYAAFDSMAWRSGCTEPRGAVHRTHGLGARRARGSSGLGHYLRP